MKEKFDTVSAKCSKYITHSYSTSFSLGINFLDRRFHEPIYAIYSFVRLADEIVDSFHEFDKAGLLAKFKIDCFESIASGISLNPVLNAFQKVVRKYNIDHVLINQFLYSMEMDLCEKNYSPEQYDTYILGSAQVVGLMCLQVFTEGNKEDYERLKMPAMQLGSAFQKVNFLRDMNADYTILQRVYFPGVEIDSFSNSDKRKIENDIEAEFCAALQGIRLLPGSSQKGVYLAYIYYKNLFRKIKKINAGKVLEKRIRISNGHKFWLLVNSLIRYNLKTL